MNLAYLYKYDTLLPTPKLKVTHCPQCVNMQNRKESGVERIYQTGSKSEIYMNGTPPLLGYKCEHLHKVTKTKQRKSNLDTC